MTPITVKFTEKELRMLATLASDQIFRMEFIDPRLPGSKSNPIELGLAKKLVERLRLTSDKAKKAPLPKKNGRVS